MGDLKSVLSDYKKYYEAVHEYSKEKVLKTVKDIKETTNAKYASDGVDGDNMNIIVPSTPTRYKMSIGKSIIHGFTYAVESKEFIYLEFGTRQKASDTLRIQTDFESRINTLAISAPYKSNNPTFMNKQGINGRYYFLNTIDYKGVEFGYTFGKKL